MEWNRDVDRPHDDEVGGAPERLDEPVAFAARKLGARRRAFRDHGLTCHQVGPQGGWSVPIKQSDQLLVHSAELLHEHLDVTAARKPDRERKVVRDPECREIGPF